MILRVSPSQLKGTVLAPPSKSVMQRLIAGALLTNGTTTIHNISDSDDCTAALHMAAQLGADIELGETSVRITGHGVPLKPRDPDLNAGESGLGLRLFTPIAALAGEPVTIEATGSLQNRPISTHQHVLQALGARLTSKDGFPPVQVHGPLLGGTAAFDASDSSQFLSGLLMALPCSTRDSSVEVKNLVSQPYIRMTLEIMEDFGITSRNNDALTAFDIPANQEYQPLEIAVDGDWSGTAFLLVAGMLAAESSITIDGLNNLYTQADEAIRGALLFAGGALSGTDEGLQVAQRPVRALNLDLMDCPDLFPPLAALAAFASKPSTLRGAHRLIHKESNRAQALVDEFAKAGIRVVHQLDEDALVIHPRAGKEKILAARLDSQGDHRMAMAAALLGLGGSHPIEITGAESVAKSYPAFFDDLESLGATVTWIKS